MTVTRKILCPSCKAALKIAATLSAGKRIRCPKCASAFAVPEAAELAPAPKASAVRSRPAAPLPQEHDELEEEPEERPAARKRSKSKKKRARNLPLALGLVIAGAVLLVGTAVTFAVVRPWEAKTRTVEASNPPGPETPRPRRPGRPGPARPGGNAESDRPMPTPSPAPAAPGTSAEPVGPGPVEKGPADSDTMKFAAGKKVYDSLDCARCHAIRGSSGGGFKKSRGPNLARVGADPAHTVEWLSEQIRDPHSHRPNSRMPDYDGKISREDLRSLAEYLASLK